LLSAGAGVRYILYQYRRLKACANSVNVASRPERDEGAITWPCSRKGGRPPFHIDPSRTSGRSKIGHWESQIGANQLIGVIETTAAGAVSQWELIPSARQCLKQRRCIARGDPRNARMQTHREFCCDRQRLDELVSAQLSGHRLIPFNEFFRASIDVRQDQRAATQSQTDQTTELMRGHRLGQFSNTRGNEIDHGPSACRAQGLWLAGAHPQ
jgi:hypothetical protein